MLQASAVGILDNFAREHDRAPERNELRDALNRADGKANGDAPIDLLTFAHAFINSAEGKFNSERKAPFHRATVSRFAVTLELLKEYTAKRAKRSTPPPVYFSEVRGIMDRVAVRGLIPHPTGTHRRGTAAGANIENRQGCFHTATPVRS
ncbi:MAG: hypothetical protein IPO60_10635 [Flavobacteriales bacterium]|nr:hypothetical protein [Flavobacteriales bacterium]